MYELTPEQIVALTECSTTLDSAKQRFRDADFDILQENKDFFYTDWKLVHDGSSEDAHSRGLYTKYKVRRSQRGKTIWTEIRSENRSEGRYAMVDAFSTYPILMLRQLRVRKLICSEKTPEILLPKDGLTLD